MALVLALALTRAQAAETGEMLRLQVLTRLREAKPVDYSFTRTTKTEGSLGKGGSHVVVEKFGPKQQWTLVSMDGRPPTEAEATAYHKSDSQRKVSGAEKVAAYLANAIPVASDRPERPVFHFSSLPKGTIEALGTDLSPNITGEVFVNNTAAVPFVEEVRLRASRSFRVKLVAKIDQWEGTNRYRPFGDGLAFLAEQTSEVSGSVMGMSGKLHSVTTYSEVRRVEN